MKHKHVVIVLLITALALSTGCGENSSLGSGNNSEDDGTGGGSTPTFNFSGIGLDYNPGMRCSDNNWTSNSPAACNPQLSFNACDTGELAGCASGCQTCYDNDLTFMKNNLGITTITIYQPNYYVIKAASTLGMKVLLGTFDDQVTALATTSTGSTDCTYAGSPALCGSGAAASFIDGACGSTTPWNPETFCQSSGAYITALRDFFTDGTIIGIQLGNEVIANGLSKATVLAAAQTMRTSLDGKNYNNIPIIVSLTAGNEADFCENGAPPANVDYIAAHPYCDHVPNSPPTWPLEDGKTAAQGGVACSEQVFSIYQQTAVASCGSDHVFIGETGYNTGCPGGADEAHHTSAAESFVSDLVTTACSDTIGTFLFIYADECPAGGCLAGCDGKPTLGNGYFGIYHTESYNTKGDLVLKYGTAPTLTCP